MWPLGAPKMSSVRCIAVTPRSRSQDKEGQKQCVAHNAFGGRGVYAIARCCTWPHTQCRLNTSSQGDDGAGCSPQDHVLTGNTS